MMNKRAQKLATKNKRRYRREKMCHLWQWKGAGRRLGSSFRRWSRPRRLAWYGYFWTPSNDTDTATRKITVTTNKDRTRLQTIVFCTWYFLLSLLLVKLVLTCFVLWIEQVRLNLHQQRFPYGLVGLKVSFTNEYTSD